MPNNTSNTASQVRIDKWLWAARFYKTRQLAIKAIKNSQILLNGQRVKPATHLRTGDTLTVKKGLYQFVIKILALSEQRGPAAQAQTLYRETDESLAERARLRQAIAAQPKVDTDRRKPDKRELRSGRALKRRS